MENRQGSTDREGKLGGKGTRFWWEVGVVLCGVFSWFAGDVLESGLFLFVFVVAGAVCGIGALIVRDVPGRLWERMRDEPGRYVRERVAKRIDEIYRTPDEALKLGTRLPLDLSQKTKTGDDVPLGVEDLAEWVRDGETILVRGLPGAGKTDLLEQLAGLFTGPVLQQEEGARVPIMLSLAGWAKDHFHLDDWDDWVV